MTPLDPGALFARAHASTEDADAVIAELVHRLASTPDDFDAWLTLGLICSEAGRTDPAEDALARALALRPSSLLARIAHARLMPPNIARRELADAHAIAPDHLGLSVELALIEIELRRFDDALRHLRAARACATTDADRARIAFALVPVGLACAGVPRLLGAPPASLAAWSTLVAPDSLSTIAAADPDPLLFSGDRLVRGDGVLILATFSPASNAAEETSVALFAFAPSAVADDDPSRANAVPLVAFVAAALGIDAVAAGDIVRRLGDAGAIDEAGARIAFTTRDVPPYGESHGIAITHRDR